MQRELLAKYLRAGKKCSTHTGGHSDGGKAVRR